MALIVPLLPGAIIAGAKVNRQFTFNPLNDVSPTAPA
jgi:hypothetical protein